MRHLVMPFALLGLVTASLFLSGLFAPDVSADWVVLTNGRILEGDLLLESDELVRVRVEGGTMTFPRSSVREIHRGGKPPQKAVSGDDRERVAHRGGATRKRGVLHYLDGTDAETKEIVLRKFIVMAPVAELAHGTCVEQIETRTINGVDMSRIKVGEREGWVATSHLRKAAAKPALRR
jgi:hypothetical protein